MLNRLQHGCLILALCLCANMQLHGREKTPQELVRSSERILFLGDSITFSGQYIVYFETWLASQAKHPLVINAGLPSETVSGLSEEGHAGGKFPRPDLAERLERVLKLAKPDLVFACYGINCGIYKPFDEERLARYQAGMRELKKQVEAAGATLVIITPPTYDDQRAKQAFSYNGVLDRYSDWLLTQRDQDWLVVDLHGPMTAALKKQRESDPAFTFQPDAVHPNEAGHWFMAQVLIRACGDPKAADAESPRAMLKQHQIPEEVLKLVNERSALLRDAYVSGAGHKRPGIKAGLPVAEAHIKAEELSQRIRKALP